MVVSHLIVLIAFTVVPKGLLDELHIQVLTVPDTLEVAALRAKLTPPIFKVSKTVAEGADTLPVIAMLTVVVKVL